MTHLTRDPLTAEAVLRSVQADERGGTCVFLGTVRPDNGALAIEYSAHEEMALQQMRRIRERAMAEFAVCDVALAHRLGRLSLGETSVVVVAAAAHRDAAFKACRFVIDTVKKDVPIWKKEIRADGESAWVDPSGEP